MVWFIGLFTFILQKSKGNEICLMLCMEEKTLLEGLCL